MTQSRFITHHVVELLSILQETLFRLRHSVQYVLHCMVGRHVQTQQALGHATRVFLLMSSCT